MLLPSPPAPEYGLNKRGLGLGVLPTQG
uniref:Uncharacterized protein n=1 Tax=Anguilla anguilla TaxID=7936 RepID=A0A0E9UB21_ANGAN